MKMNISRQNLYLLALSTFLLIFVLLFSFLLLIPKGKEYREQRTELNKGNVELRKYQDFNEETLEILKKLQSDNGHVITAFDNTFNAARFEKEHKNYFNTLTLSKLEKSEDEEDEFSVYEVQTTSQINSPKSFYDFLDAVNKSSWIIGINFPINFKREEQMIRSSFTMKVYSVKRDSNTPQ
ncbi:MAG: hypothetical protein AUK54_10275 [Helicobacteraceae bacterium CG2_30_36_10]|nr:MAG: hypothetical protein AUK54_10275 [Helicobacteraceae bacterium CG2_30_36_10]